MVKRKSKSKDTTVESLVEESMAELLSLMGIEGKVEITKDKENQALLVNIDTKEAGLLIGSRGETINSLQSILGMIVRQRHGQWQRILVNVADWREKEEERLRDLAQTTSQRVKETGEPESLYNLTPAQRRIVHMVLADDDDVVTESQEEGRDRCLVVSISK